MDSEFHTVRGYQLLQKNKMLLTPAMEDYLEMIYRNTKETGYLRMNDLAEKLNVRASSATKMMQRLGELRLIKYKKYGIIELSESGKELGEFLLHRHNTVEAFLRTIGIKDNILVETELIEHYISVNTLRHMEILNSFFSSHPDLSNRLESYIRLLKEES